MTPAERESIRRALTANGFRRAFYTQDLSGDGVYEETWRKGADIVTIQWGPKENSNERF